VLLILLFSLLSSSQLYAQEYGIYEITKGKKDKDNKGKSGNRDNFYDLALKLQPTHYIENNSIKKSYNAGDPIKVTIEDSKSYNYMKNKNSKYPNVEIIIISLEKPNDIKTSTIDLSNDKEYKKLKYVYIKCNSNCSEKDVKDFIKVNNNVRIFYSKEKQS
jgi:hypothetical protein